MIEGQIIKNISDTYTVTSNNKLYVCKARGKFRNLGITPLVGDLVKINAQDKYIMEVLPRKNELKRPSISNIDIALIVTSLKKPDISLNLLDKEISSIILAHIEPVICFTKLDLASPKELEELDKLSKYYTKIGIKVFNNNDIPSLIKYLQGKLVVLTGQSGAGKSSLLNKLDSSLNLKEGEISEALNRGKHTTRHTEVYEVRGIYIADTPGFSSLNLDEYSKSEIRDSFKEFQNHNCEYRDCMHLKEENCDIKRKVNEAEILQSRYDNYCNFINIKR